MINTELINAELTENRKEHLSTVLKEDRKTLAELYNKYRSAELELKSIAMDIENVLGNIETTKNRLKGEENV